MISIEITFEDNDRARQTLTMWQESGPNWAGGTIVDLLNDHLSGARRVEKIIVDPNAKKPSFLGGDS